MFAFAAVDLVVDVSDVTHQVRLLEVALLTLRTLPNSVVFVKASYVSLQLCFAAELPVAVVALILDAVHSLNVFGQERFVVEGFLTLVALDGFHLSVVGFDVTLQRFFQVEYDVTHCTNVRDDLLVENSNVASKVLLVSV